jgi:hypothetical protein
MTRWGALVCGLLIVGVLAQGASARESRGTYCETIKVHTPRHQMRETWKVYRVRGTCALGRATIARYQRAVTATVAAGACVGNHCSNAPAPPGFACSGASAAQEARTGYVLSCRGDGAVYRSYEDHGYAGKAARVAPKVACFDLSTNRLRGYLSHPKECWLKPRWSGFGNVLTGARWSSWGMSAAAGRGASYRLWADIEVRLSAPRRACGTTLFTRALVHYVGGGDEYWPDKTYTLRTC